MHLRTAGTSIPGVLGSGIDVAVSLGFWEL